MTSLRLRLLGDTARPISRYSKLPRYHYIHTSRAFAMPIYKGGCYCGELKYTVDVSPDDARTSLCHCNNCKVCMLVHSILCSKPRCGTGSTFDVLPLPDSNLKQRNSSALPLVLPLRYQSRLFRTPPSRRNPQCMKPIMAAVPPYIGSFARHAGAVFWRCKSIL